jgi:rRNA maturation RNase YbeY
MITIKNSQKKIKIDVHEIHVIVQKMLQIAGYIDFDVGIWFTTNKTIKKYNFEFLKKNEPTDILSFPYHAKLKPGEKIDVKSDDDKNIGDIIISLECAERDAERENRSLEMHIKILLAHGIAHLLGYDHKTDKEYEVMQAKERELLK